MHRESVSRLSSTRHDLQGSMIGQESFLGGVYSHYSNTMTLMQSGFKEP